MAKAKKRAKTPKKISPAARVVPFNFVYVGVAAMMNKMLKSGANLDEARKLYIDFQVQNGGSYTFGTFANFYFKNKKVYGMPDNAKAGLPQDEGAWLRDAFSFEPKQAAQMAGWVRQRLIGATDHPLFFTVLPHDGPSTALFFLDSKGDQIWIYCPKVSV